MFNWNTRPSWHPHKMHVVHGITNLSEDDKKDNDDGGDGGGGDDDDVHDD